MTLTPDIASLILKMSYTYQGLIFIEKIVLKNCFVLTGNVDIWSLEAGTQPFQNFIPTTGNQYCPKICLSSDGSTISASYGPYIDVLHRDRKEAEFSVVQHFDCCSKV